MTDLKIKSRMPGEIADSFHLIGNVLFFKDYWGNFYASDLGNRGFGDSFLAFTPGYGKVTLGVGKQVSLGETDLTLLNTSSSHVDKISSVFSNPFSFFRFRSVPALGETRKLEPWLSGSIEYYNSANVQNYSTEAWKSNTGVIAADNSSNLYKLDLFIR